jgi:hypothetical protein
MASANAIDTPIRKQMPVTARMIENETTTELPALATNRSPKNSREDYDVNADEIGAPARRHRFTNEPERQHCQEDYREGCGAALGGSMYACAEEGEEDGE